MPIQARPAQQSQQAPQRIQAQPIKARPAQATSIPARPAQAIKARPVGASPASCDPIVAYRAGLQQLVNKNFPAAINQFELAQSQGNVSYDVLYNLGRAHRQYGQSVRDLDQRLSGENMTQAAEYFEQAVRLKPDALDAYFQLGMCYRDLALYPRATAAFKRSLALSPQDPATYYQLGLVAVEEGSSREAEGYFLDGLKINPDHALILVALGRLYAESRQQLPSAISSLRRATQIDPALWEAWYELGRAHMKEKEWKYALSALERGRQVNASVPEIYSAMATCFLRMNKKPEARQMVSEALQRDPKNAEALRIQKQI
ncbi:MAG: hypothetical protein PVSMB5_34470 [Ktedonobacteraceae bacterium]